MSEFVYIREPFIEAYTKISDERGDPIDNIEAFAYSMCQNSPYKSYDWGAYLKRGQVINRGFPPQYRYYVLCASCDHDTANMWNYYVKNGMYRGYNLGLDIEVIQNWFSGLGDEHVRLVHDKVIYNKQHQVKMLYEKLVELLNIYDQHIAHNPEGEDSIIGEYQDDLLAFINEKKLFLNILLLQARRNTVLF